MLPIVLFQLFAAAAAAPAVVPFNLQLPFALFGGEPPRLPPFPFPRPEPPRPPTHTVYDLIHGDDRFKKLDKAIHFVGDEIISVLNDTARQITFFAVPDKALLPPRRDDDGKKHGKKKHKRISELLDSTLSVSSPFDAALQTLLDASVSLTDALELIEELEPENLVDCVMDDNDDRDDEGNDEDDNDDDDPDKKKRREIFRHIVKAILEYHVLPHGGYDLSTLSHNTTYSTTFKVPKLFGGHGQRITVSEQIKKKKNKSKTFINLYAQVTASDVKADNGFIHVLNHPLLPPPAVFQELFLAQRPFSTLTSALQRTGLTDELDVRYVKDDAKGHLEGSTAVTVFAPTNEAFQRLPKRLQLYLFSPFGQHVLRKLLEYHIIPGVVAHADALYNQTAETSPNLSKTRGLFDLADGMISSVNITLNTRLVNHTIDWSSEKFKFTKKKQEVWENKIFVNDQLVQVPDIVALNGAVHVLDRVLCPCHGRRSGGGGSLDDIDFESGGDAWEDWESWLPQWAA